MPPGISTESAVYESAGHESAGYWRTGESGKGFGRSHGCGSDVHENRPSVDAVTVADNTSALGE